MDTLAWRESMRQPEEGVPFDVFVATLPTVRALPPWSGRLPPRFCYRTSPIDVSAEKHGETHPKPVRKGRKSRAKTPPGPGKRRNKRRPGVQVSAMFKCRDLPGIETLALDPCAYCAGPSTLHDHIEPVYRGGTHAPDNLTRACWRCNAAKGTASLLLYLARRASKRR